MKAAIIIPVYNMQDTVGEAIESAVAQTYPDREVVVVDDGSIDKSYSVAVKYHSAVTHVVGLRQNMGIQRAVNFAVRLYADDADAIVVLGADDTLHPEFLDATMPVLSDPEVAVVSTDMQYFGADDRICSTRGVSPTENNIPATSLIRKSVWDQMHGYDENMAYEDWDLWLRIFAADWKFDIVPAPLFNHRTGKNPRTTLQNQNRIKYEQQILDRHGWMLNETTDRDSQL